MSVAQQSDLARFVEEARRSDAEAEAFEGVEAAMERLQQLCRNEKLLCWRLPFDPSLLGPRAERDFEATLGITRCDAAVVDTGSVLLGAGEGKPRLASLSVRTHICLVDPGDLVPDLAAALAKAAALKTGQVSLITGPSRTADIEMTLTRGVHGPKRLLILVAPWNSMERNGK